MITVGHIRNLQSNLEDDTELKIVFQSEAEIILQSDERIDESADGTVLFIRRNNGRCVLVNLEKVEFICESKKYL